MIIEQIIETGNARRNVWCKLSDLTDNGNNTYSFVSLDGNAIGFGSRVEVIDADMVLFYDNETQLLYPWLLKDEGGNG